MGWSVQPRDAVPLGGSRARHAAAGRWDAAAHAGCLVAEMDASAAGRATVRTKASVARQPARDECRR